ncbi:ECF-type sigma factor [Luteitalea sp.]|uniref:ECF-type sigma factor n=1 Tax=Luteitalea sp. TaxID=2004800 RepID=UPI0025BDB1E7|nr:ECF-type sigma factor [Luteitalea sp.]
MVDGAADEITQLLHAWAGGNADALPRLLAIVYPELRKIAARRLSGERPDHTLEPTGLVHEAYLRLAHRPDRHWENRTHFYAVAARVVRAVLVDHARSRGRIKRGSGAVSVELTEASAGVPPPAVDLLDLDAALQELEAIDATRARIVELRHFAGLSNEETAEALGISVSTVKRGWLAAKTWIRRRMEGQTRQP